MSSSDSVAVPVPGVILHFNTISIPSPNLTYYLLIVVRFLPGGRKEERADITCLLIDG